MSDLTFYEAMLAKNLKLNQAITHFRPSVCIKPNSILKNLPILSYDSDNKIYTISARELVPGDIVSFGIGDRIPADLRIISVRKKILILLTF